MYADTQKTGDAMDLLSTACITADSKTADLFRDRLVSAWMTQKARGCLLFLTDVRLTEDTLQLPICGLPGSLGVLSVRPIRHVATPPSARGPFDGRHPSPYSWLDEVISNQKLTNTVFSFFSDLRTGPKLEEIQRKSRVREWTPQNAPRIRAGVTKKDQRAELKKNQTRRCYAEKTSIFSQTTGRHPPGARRETTEVKTRKC